MGTEAPVIKMAKGATLVGVVAKKNPDDTPIDITGWTVELYDVEGLTNLALAITDAAQGLVELTIPEQNSDALARGDFGKFAIKYRTPEGRSDPTTLIGVKIE